MHITIGENNTQLQVIHQVVMKHHFCHNNPELLPLILNHLTLNDIISVKEKSTSKNLIENNVKANQVANIPGHLKFDSSKLEATVLDYCDRNDVGLQLDELLVIEYYSRR